MKLCKPSGTRPMTTPQAHATITTRYTRIAHSARTMKCGIASSRRKNTVRRVRCRSSVTIRPIGWRSAAAVGSEIVSDIGSLLELEAAAAREARVAAGEQEQVRVRLRLVPKAVRDQVAHSFRHPAERETDEPAGERDHLRDSSEHGGEDVSGYDEHDPERGDQARLRLRRVDLQVDRIRARLAGEARERVRDEQHVRVDVNGVSHPASAEALHVFFAAAREQRREPVEHEHCEERPAPEVEPNEVRDDEREPEEDRQPRAAQIVVDEHPDRMRLGYLPLKLGSRFSRNACTPSRKSSDCVAAAWSCASHSSCSSSVEPPARSSKRFVMPIAFVGIAASRAASSAARLGSSSASTTSETRPQACASAALSRRPLHSHSKARAYPSRRVTKNVLPESGTRPMFTNAGAKTAASEAMRMSHAHANDIPAP